MMLTIEVPDDWLAEGVEPPSPACLSMAYQITDELKNSQGIVPDVITASRVGGIFIRLPRRNGRVLEIEVDNDLDVVAMVCSEAKIARTELVTNLSGVIQSEYLMSKSKDIWQDTNDPALWSSEFPVASAETAGHYWILPPLNQYGYQMPRVAFLNFNQCCGVDYWSGDVFSGNSCPVPEFERNGQRLSAAGWKCGPRVPTPRECVAAME